MQSGTQPGVASGIVATFIQDLANEAAIAGVALDVSQVADGPGTVAVTWRVKPAANASIPAAPLTAGRSYVAALPQDWLGQLVDAGECVAFVQAASGAPHTAAWRQGPLVRGAAGLPSGTAIATFDPDGTYGNHTDGRSHAAIYDTQDAGQLWVYDQWRHPSVQPVHRRPLRFGGGAPVNDGDQFHVIVT